MLTLYGFQFSNYVSMVQLALLEKGVPFIHVETIPDRSTESLSKSPLGKVPFIETSDGFLSETNVILEYLEESYSEVPLLPRTPYGRAVTRRLMKQLELYVELPARRCFPEAFFERTIPNAVREQARSELLAGIRALTQCGLFAPFVAGDQFTLADIMFLYSLQPAIAVGERVLGLDVFAECKPAKDLAALLNDRPHVRAIAAKRAAARPEYVTRMKRVYGPAEAAWIE